jgi:hypothetical protein
VAKGESGRLVIEIDPSIKKELYDTLGDKGLNMKEWFLINAKAYLQKNKRSSHNTSKASKEVGS